MIPKHLFYLFLTIGIICCGDDDDVQRACLPANLQNGLIAFYPFSNGSLDDASVNANHILNPSSARPSKDRNDNVNCAFQFDNSQVPQAYLTTSNSAFLNGLDEFSISIWYKPMDSTRSAGSFEVLLSRGDEGRCPDRRGEWSIGLFDCRRAVFGHNNSVWANTMTGFSNGCSGEVEALTGQWHHVVATKSGDEYNIYFNGNLDDSASGNALCLNLHLAQDIGDLFVGKYFTGKIDDVMIYNRALAQMEVTELFQLQPCCE